MSLVNPSFSNGFASPWYGGRMKYADIWRGCVGAWAPILGPTGATLFDFSSGSRFPGGTENMDPATDWVASQHGLALDFDGSNDLVRLPAALSQFTVGAFSLSAWIYTRSGGGQTLWRNDGGSGGGSNGTTFRLSGGKVQIELYNSFRSLTGATTVSQNVWHHVGVSVGLTAWSVYLDGRPDATGVVTPLTSAPAITPLIGTWGAGEYLNGMLACMGMWSRPLTDSEMQLLAQRPGIMYELDDSDVWGAVEAGGSVPWWAFANRQSRIIGGGVT